MSCDCLKKLYRALDNWQPPEFSSMERVRMAVEDALKGKFDPESKEYKEPDEEFQ